MSSGAHAVVGVPGHHQHVYYHVSMVFLEGLAWLQRQQERAGGSWTCVCMVRLKAGFLQVLHTGEGRRVPQEEDDPILWGLPCCLAGASGTSHQRLSSGSHQGVYSFTGPDWHWSTSQWGNWWLNLLMACLEGGGGVAPKLYPCLFHARPVLFHIIPRKERGIEFLFHESMNVFHVLIPHNSTYSLIYSTFLFHIIPHIREFIPRSYST